MKKLLVVALIVALAAGTVFPLVLGIAAKNQVAYAASQLGRSEALRLQIADYERRWYDSRAKIVLGLRDNYRNQIESQILAARAESLSADQRAELRSTLDSWLRSTVTVYVNVDHGPVILGKALSFGLADADITIDAQAGAIKDLQDRLGLPDLLVLKARTSLTGVTKFDGGIPAVAVENGDSRIDFSGFDLSGSIDWGKGAFDLRANTDRIEVNEPETSMSVSGLKMEANQRRLADYVWLGDAEFRIDRIAAAVADPSGTAAIELVNLTVDMNVQPGRTAQTVDLVLTQGFSSFVLPGQMKMQDAVVRLNLTDIDVSAVATAYELNQRSYGMNRFQLMEMLPELQAVGFGLLSRSPGIAVDPLSFMFNDELFNMRLSIGTSRETLPPRQLFDLTSAAMWAQVLNGKLEVDATQQLARMIAARFLRDQLADSVQPGMEVSAAEVAAMAEQQAPALLGQFVQQGLIRETGTGYASSISYGREGITLNGVSGTTLPLPF